ncbi:acyltransferase [Aquimarina sp. 2201CG1-2-11]
MSPNAYAKKVGVKYGKNCIFRTKYFGSEPYLIEIGNNVATSSNVHFVTHDGSLWVIRNLYENYKNADSFGNIVIGDNVFIGINVTILPKTKVGNNVIIGAGSIVRGELNSNSVYAGCPVKYICSLEQYLEKSKANFLNTNHMNPLEKKMFLNKK